MLQDAVHPPERLATEGFSSSAASQSFDFCDDSDIFSETLRNSEVPSCSGGGCGGGASVSCYDDVSLPLDFSLFSSMDASTLSALLDLQTPEPDPGVVLHSDYPPVELVPPPAGALFPSYFSSPQDQLDATVLPEFGVPAVDGSFSSYAPDSLMPPSAVPQRMTAPSSLPSVFEDDCVPSLSGYMGLDSAAASTSRPFAAPTIGGGAFYTGAMGASASGESLGLYPRCMVMGAEPAMSAPSEVVADYHGESCGGDVKGIYGADHMAHRRIYTRNGDLQLVSGSGGSAPLAAEVAPLDESAFKVGRLSAEERKEKIHRYLKKRNERNFSKKIKYACRKTLADSRPRVRGRFARNDEYGEASKSSSCDHDDEDEEEFDLFHLI